MSVDCWIIAVSSKLIRVEAAAAVESRKKARAEYHLIGLLLKRWA